MRLGHGTCGSNTEHMEISDISGDVYERKQSSDQLQSVLCFTEPR
jgi:hypothetical protein